LADVGCGHADAGDDSRLCVQRQLVIEVWPTRDHTNSRRERAVTFFAAGLVLKSLFQNRWWYASRMFGMTSKSGFDIATNHPAIYKGSNVNPRMTE
jgi:hypothetical protein